MQDKDGSGMDQAFAAEQSKVDKGISYLVLGLVCHASRFDGRGDVVFLQRGVERQGLSSDEMLKLVLDAC